MNNMMKNNEACVFVKLYEQNCSIELNDDYILPDYLVDIKKIISMNSVIGRSGSFISDGTLEYDGDVILNVLYISEDDHIRSVSFSGEYDGAIPIEGINEDCIAMLIPECMPVVYKLSNPRKLNIKTTVKLSVAVFCKKCISPKITGRHTLEDEINLEKRESELPAMLISVVGENAVSVSDDITIDSTHPQISEIISTVPEFYIYETRVADKKLSYRGDVLVTCLYVGESGEDESENYNIITKKLAVSGTIDAGEAQDGCECMPVVICSPAKAEPVKNSVDEIRIIELDFSYDIMFLCSLCNTVSVINDSYSTDCDCCNNFIEIEVMRQGRSNNGNFSINESTPLDDAGIPDAVELSHIGAQIARKNVRLDEDKNKIIIEADIRFNAAAKNKEGIPAAGTFERPVRLELDGMRLHGPVEFKLSTSVISLRGRIDQNNIYADMEFGVNIGVYETSRVKLLDTIQLDRIEKTKVCGGRYPITLYYPHPGEALWDIAKKYNTTVKAIKNANSLNSDEISTENVLIIPRGGIKPAYSKLI